jgi:hypothetical protein
MQVYQHTLSHDALEPALIPEFKRLFCAVFGADVPPEFLKPAFLNWKFFRSRPGWEGSRSFIVQREGSILAHACVWPTAFHTPAKTVSSCHLLDWVASPDAPGAGITLYRELMDLSETTIVIGGSPQAQRLLPKLDFRPYGSLRYFSRVIRPLRQFCARPKQSVRREVLRFARNTVWTLPSLKRAGTGWVAIQEARAGGWLDDLVSSCKFAAFSSGARSSALVNYLLDCPAARGSLYAVTRKNQPCGYFLLNEVHGQTRVIDLFVRSTDPEAWEAASTLALGVAAGLPGTCEVVTASAMEWLDDVFRRCGMREREARPVLLYDSRGLLAGAPPLHIQMIDSDAFLMYVPSHLFLT